MKQAFVGVLLQIVAISIIAFGNLLQKIALRRCVALNKNFIKYAPWWIAQLCIFGAQPVQAGRLFNPSCYLLCWSSYNKCDWPVCCCLKSAFRKIYFERKSQASFIYCLCIFNRWFCTGSSILKLWESKVHDLWHWAFLSLGFAYHFHCLLLFTLHNRIDYC